jgi:hypothetical protein
MSQHIFQFESELKNSAEAAPKASPSFSVSEKLARYGSTARIAAGDFVREVSSLGKCFPNLNRPSSTN